MNFLISRNTSNWLKFISAIVVALHHYSQYVWEHHISEDLVYGILSFQGGFTAVALFFFLSGYGLMESEKKMHLSFYKFLKKRLARVYLPALFVTLLWLPIESILLNKPIGGGKIFTLGI